MTSTTRRSALATGVLLGIFSDGLFHVGSALLLLWGAARLWRDRATPDPLHSRAIFAGVLIGAEGFNAHDGLVQHLVLHLHLVNEQVCPRPMDDNSIASGPQDLPYEIVWIAVGAAVANAGFVGLRRVAAASLRPSAPGQLDAYEGDDHG